MRQLIAALVVFALPAVAAAQSQPPGKSSAGTQSVSPPPLPSIGLPLPSIGLPLPSIGLPLPSIGLEPSPAGQRLPSKTDPTSGARDRNHRQRPHAVPQVVYFGAFYPWGGESLPAPGMVAANAAAIGEPVVGRLRLEVGPAYSAQLFVDGVFFGTSEDVGGEIAMEPGVRRIEIRADGFETLIVHARIVGGQTITYRGSLRPLAPEPPSAASSEPVADASHTSPQSRTIYFIPGCYLGNVPPGEVKLPSDCDLSRLIIRTP